MGCFRPGFQTQKALIGNSAIDHRFSIKPPRRKSNQHVIVFRLAALVVLGLWNPIAGNASRLQANVLINDDRIEKIGIVKSTEIDESSGLALSYRFSNAMWTHNDSGGKSALFLISDSGKLLATVTLQGVKNRDWEDICSFQAGEKSFLLIGDVGDNGRRHQSCTVYLLEEPELDLKRDEPVHLKTDRFQRIAFTYSDGPRDCEAITYDPNEKVLWLIDKVGGRADRSTKPGVYRLALDYERILWDRNDSLEGSAKSAKRVTDFPHRNVTAMEFSPDGRSLIVRSYFQAWLLRRGEDQKWSARLDQSDKLEQIAIPIQRQGEAICFSKDSSSLLLTSEKTRQPIWRVELPSAK